MKPIEQVTNELNDWAAILKDAERYRWLRDNIEEGANQLDATCDIGMAEQLQGEGREH